VLLREPDFRGRDAAMVVFMRSSAVRENEDLIRRGEALFLKD
jgi:hypothetical protein